MSKLSAGIFTILAVGAVGYAVLQQRAVEQLRGENRTLREQMEAGGTPGPGNVPAKGAASAPDSRESAATSTSIAAAGGAPTGAAPAGNGLATPATDPMRELLRLRSEVGQLRRSVQESAAAATAARRAGANATAGAGTGGPGSGPPPPNPGEDNQPYTAHLSANVVKGNTLVAGGWSTEPGKRTLLLLTPDFGTANLTTGQVSPAFGFCESARRSAHPAGTRRFSNRRAREHLYEFVGQCGTGRLDVQFCRHRWGGHPDRAPDYHRGGTRGGSHHRPHRAGTQCHLCSPAERGPTGRGHRD